MGVSPLGVHLKALNIFIELNIQSLSTNKHLNLVLLALSGMEERKTCSILKGKILAFKQTDKYFNFALPRNSKNVLHHKQIEVIHRREKERKNLQILQ